MAIRLKDEDIDVFQRDGAICLRQVFSEEWLAKIRLGIEKNLERPSQYSECLKGDQGSGSYFNDYCNWQRISEFRDLAFHSSAPHIAAQLTGSQALAFYHEHVLTKDAGTFKVTPWHHDQAYYPVDGEKNCSIWIPIDPVPLHTTIEFVKGSHRWGKWFHPKKFATEKNYQVESEADETRGGHVFEEMPDIDSRRDHYEFLRWDTKPGDCVVFHMKTVHGAPANKTGRPRRVVSMRFLGDDCVLARRPWTVSPPITGGLHYGDRMVCGTFPLVFGQLN